VNRLTLGLAAIMLALTVAMPCYAIGANQKADEPEIIERIIRIEGTIEKPRVLFIVPRAVLWRQDRHRKKSFVTEILEPVYPESLIKSQ